MRPIRLLLPSILAWWRGRPFRKHHKGHDYGWGFVREGMVWFCRTCGKTWMVGE